MGVYLHEVSFGRSDELRLSQIGRLDEIEMRKVKLKRALIFVYMKYGYV